MSDLKKTLSFVVVVVIISSHKLEPSEITDIQQLLITSKNDSMQLNLVGPPWFLSPQGSSAFLESN